MGKMDGVRRATGRDRYEWFALLDAWGAAGRQYREIADWLMGEHDVSRWWAQKLIVEYEQARGRRPPGVRPDGTFAVNASKTVAVPVKRLFDAFVDPELRERWLPSAVMRERTSQLGRSARFDWEDGSTRVNVDFTDKGRSKIDGRAGARKAELDDDTVVARHSRRRKRTSGLRRHVQIHFLASR
jgi:hypothetical protein